MKEVFGNLANGTEVLSIPIAGFESFDQYMEIFYYFK